MQTYRRFFVTFIVSLFTLAALTACGGEQESAAPEKDASSRPEAASANTVTLTGINILDQSVLQRDKPVIITFSAPMVPADAVDKAVPEADIPFSISPPLKGETRWLTQSSVAFLAAKQFPRGQKYTLHIKENLKSLDGEPVEFAFSFATQGTQVDRLEPGIYDANTLTQQLHISFSLPVSLTALREHLSVKDAQSGEALELDFSQTPKNSSRHQVIVRLGQVRENGITVTVRMDKTDDTELLGFAKDYEANLRLDTEGGPAEVASTDESPSSISFYSPYSYEEQNGSISLSFPLSRGLLDQAQSDFISVTPDLPYELHVYGGALLFQNLEPQTDVTVTLKPGLKDAEGKTLQQEISLSHSTPDRSPAVRLADPGHFLTPVFGSRLGLDLVNVDKISITLKRQYDNNLPLMNLQSDYLAERMMRGMAYKEFLLGASEKNEVYRKALDIADLAGGKHGVFMLYLTAYTKDTDSRGDVYYRYASSTERIVVLTDINSTARVFPSGITVFASRASTGKPLPDALIQVYSASNQLLAEGRSNAEGLFVHKRSSPWEKELQPSIIVTQTGQGDSTDITFMPLSDQTALSASINASRAYLDDGYEAFVYTPRGVFRPGEKVDVKAFVRDKDMSPPKPFPVLFTITSSRGIEIASGSVPLSSEGGADFSLTLPQSAPTGSYRVEVTVPGQQDTIGFHLFSVEDFTPPRLEVAVTPQKDALHTKDALPVTLSGQYLFGAPGNGLDFELGYRAVASPFQPEGWEGFAFGDGEKRFTAQVNLKAHTGQLDGTGLAELSLAAPADWTEASTPLKVQLVGNVKEDGGRWVTQTGFITYYPTPYFLGIKTDGVFSPGKAGRIDIAAVTPDGKTADPGKLRVEVIEVRGSWHTVARNDRYIYVWNEQLLPRKGSVIDSADGAAAYDFTPGDYGEYLVRVSTEDRSVVASHRFSVWGDDGYGGEDGAGRMDQVELAFDKPAYQAGETARLSVKAPYAGTLFLGLERGEQMENRIIAMPQPSTIVEIPVTEAMSPNITVTAWVIRPVREEEREWFPHRAYGVAALALSKEQHVLNVSTVLPERASPDAPLTVHFTVTDQHGTPVEGEFSVALVDEGILSLTAYETPDPVDYFMALRYPVGNSYDLFDLMLRPEAKATPLLQPGGGGMASYQGSLSTQQVFLAAYQPMVKTDANGQGEVTFAIPEYSGKGRLMVVGAAQQRFASAAAPIRFARDIVVETSAPRAVAPGDSFAVFLKLFTLPPADGKQLEGEARVRLSATGPITFGGTAEYSFPLAGEGQKPAAHQAEAIATAENAHGIGVITATVEVPGRDDLSYSKSFEIAVRPPFPRTSASAQSMLRGGGSAELSVPGAWTAGTADVSLAIDRSPVLAVLPVLEYLRDYPYGCLEQVTSRAWPYLTLSSVQKALYPAANAAKAAEASLQDIVSRILSMQTFGGGFGMWPGYAAADPWRSVNATFFLVEARRQIPIPPAPADRALGYLRYLLAAPAEQLGDEVYAYTTKAYAAFVLSRAGEAPLGWLQHLSENTEYLMPSGHIFLAGAKALQAGNSGPLLALDKEQMSFEPVPGSNDSLESDLRNRSLELYMWTLVDPSHKRALQLSLDIAAELGKKRYFTTQEAGMASLALGAYLEATDTGAGSSFTAEILADGQPFATVSNERKVFGGGSIPTREDGSLKTITVKVRGGQAYAVYNVRGVPATAPEPVSSGMKVQRVWLDAGGNVIDLSSGTARLKKGDRVTVELTVITETPLSNVALSDLLPGGMEVENARLQTAGAIDNPDVEEGDGLYMDLREDRLLVFFDQVEQRAVFRYSMRAVSKGTFVLPPLAADAMYAPLFNAISPAGTVIIE